VKCRFLNACKACEVAFHDAHFQAGFPAPQLFFSSWAFTTFLASSMISSKSAASASAVAFPIPEVAPVMASVLWSILSFIHFDLFIFAEPFGENLFEGHRFEFTVHFLYDDVCRRAECTHFSIAIDDFKPVIRAHAGIFRHPRP